MSKEIEVLNSKFQFIILIFIVEIIHTCANRLLLWWVGIALQHVNFKKCKVWDYFLFIDFQEDEDLQNSDAILRCSC